MGLAHSDCQAPRSDKTACMNPQSLIRSGFRTATAGHQHHTKEEVPRAHLIHPVGVEDAQAAQLAACTLLCHAAQIPGGLQLCHTLVHWLAVDDTLHQPETVVMKMYPRDCHCWQVHLASTATASHRCQFFCQRVAFNDSRMLGGWL
jgi:hypothetical protein